jgi:uncharacterized membrane protein
MLPTVLIVVGVLMGIASNEVTGGLLGGAIGWLIWRALSLQREVAALNKRLDDVAARSAQAAEPVIEPARRAQARAASAAAAAGEGVEPAAAAIAMPAQGSTAERPTEASAEPAVEPAPAEAASARPPIAAPPKPSVFEPLRQWLFGGNTIVKAGVGILFIGLAFLAKYASEHVNLPIEFRLAGIAGAAIVLLALGWRLRDKRAGYAQVLQGGAIAVLYLTVFTAFRYYQVVGAGPAFALMAVVAALAAALAVLQNAQSLAAIGALGGFATPLLLSTGGGSHVGLFSYYLLLDLGIAAVAWFRTWRWLNLIGFGFTFGVGTLWGVFSYRSEFYGSAQAFLVAFFVAFVAILLMPARRLGAEAELPAHRGERWVNGSLLFGLPTIAFGLQYGLVHDTRYGVALSALVLAAFYVALAVALRSRPRLGLAFEGSLAVGTVFLTLVIPFALDGRATAGAWALEGAGLVWLGFRQARWLARTLGYALLLVAGLLLAHAIDRQAAPASLINATLLSGLMLVAGALIAAFFVRRHAAPGPMLRSERIAEPLLIGWALLAAAAMVIVHVEALVEPRLRLAALIGSLAAVAALHVALGARLAWRGVSLPVIGYALLLLLATASSAAFQDAPFEQGGWWAWPLALAAHGAALRLVAPAWPNWGRHAAHAVGALVVAMLGALFGRGLLAGWGDVGSAWPWLGWLAVPALMLLVLPRDSFARRWPVRELPDAYSRSAAGALAVILLLWTLLANVASNGAATPLPHVPVINPLDLGVALALFAAWRWSASGAGRGVVGAWPSLPHAVLGGFGFVWLNAMLVRGFHHLGGVPFEFDAWTSSLTVQTGLTLLWTATALPLMWWSARRGQRMPWMVGAALLGVVVLKLLLVDLSASGTVTRIVSFIGAGVLMLVIGYVAPLPGKKHASA